MRRTLAAIDLGSNSFHMIVGQLVHDELVVVDRLREQVQLAAGLDERGNLAVDARRRALRCLERFGQRLRELPQARVRAVGTRTLRVARDSRGFRSAARAALGHPVEVISGHEEARLIYLGVAHKLADDAGTRLVVDIGGGSTELILGERFECDEAHSLSMGCVVFTERFFRSGALKASAFEEAMLAASAELQTLQRRFVSAGWQHAVGASGTVRATETVLHEAGWCDKGISAKGLARLRQAMIDARRVRDLSLPGLKEERAPVFAGGVAILSAIFESLGLEHMDVASGALREGVLYDLLGRIRHEDVRERTITALQERYHVERGQAERVEATALRTLSQVADSWGLKRHDAEQFLTWAARVHEIGRVVAYDHYQRHGAYLLMHGEMAGFSRDDQLALAALVGNHRRKPRPELVDGVPRKSRRQVIARLTLLLRLAVLLNRNRSPQPLVPATLEARGEELTLSLPRAWLDTHPLTRVDIRGELKAARALGLAFDFREVDD